MLIKANQEYSTLYGSAVLAREVKRRSTNARNLKCVNVKPRRTMSLESPRFEAAMNCVLPCSAHHRRAQLVRDPELYWLVTSNPLFVRIANTCTLLYDDRISADNDFALIVPLSCAQYLETTDWRLFLSTIARIGLSPVKYHAVLSGLERAARAYMEAVNRR